MKHRDVKYVSGEKNARILVNDPRFISLTELGDDVFEIEMKKSSINLDMPIVLGFFVLNYAKLRMLDFYYSCLDRYVDRSDFELLETDTDSLYFAISGPTLDSVIKPDFVNEYRSKIYDLCHSGDISANNGFWFPRVCCAEHGAFDLRTPGLFKLEGSGTEMVCLSSKTYVLQTDSGNFKLSCKGINKRVVKEPLDIFLSVLNTQKSVSVQNRGFRAKSNSVWTYLQEKTGFSYFYCKREILADGVRTIPLKLTLSPWVDHGVECFDVFSPL